MNNGISTEPPTENCDQPPPTERTHTVDIYSGFASTLTIRTEPWSSRSTSPTNGNDRNRDRRKLSRKQHGSNNYETQRCVAECHTGLRRKRRDFLHKLSAYDARECDLVTVDPRGTIKEHPSCGVSTDKPLWVRECSSPACGFETDRNTNAVVRLRLVGCQTQSNNVVETGGPLCSRWRSRRSHGS